MRPLRLLTIILGVFSRSNRMRITIGASDEADTMIRRSYLPALALCTGDAADAAARARHTVEHHLTAHNLAGRFHEIVGHGDCEFGKPAPDPFLKATECLGVEPRLCLALEDLHNGVRSASSAGMMTVMVPDLLEPPAGRPRASRRALPQSARRGPSTRCGAPCRIAARCDREGPDVVLWRASAPAR